MNFAILPNLTALTVLVAVFWAISRKATSQQVHLWLLGWVLILAHFAAAAVPLTAQMPWPQLSTGLSVGCLVLAGVAFLISVSPYASDPRRQALFALALALPAFVYANGAILGITDPDYYYVLTAIGLLAPLLVLWRDSKQGKLFVVGQSLAVAVVAVVMLVLVRRGNAGMGIIAILAALNLATAVLYWRHHRRSSAGVLTTVSGFILWGLGFPAAILLGQVASSVKIESEVWNIPTYLVAIGMILTLLEDQIDKSTYLAYHDELTDLPNLRLLEDRLDQALAQAKRASGKLAVCMLDLDHFKEVNDTYGHRVGDIALREVVARLNARVRASDTLARSGGDEFTLVSHVAGRKAAETLVLALQSALSEPISVEGRQVRVGVSVGVALYPDDGSNADELCAAADRAMYAFKHATRNHPATMTMM